MAEIRLKGITWDHARGYEPLKACSKEFHKQFSIEIVWKKRSLKDFGDKSLTDLAQEFDLLIIDHPHSGIASTSRCVLPMEDFIPLEKLDQLRTESAGPSFGSYNYEGHQWALPIDSALQVAAYRPDLMNDHPPKNWKTVLKCDNLGMALCPTDSLCCFLSLAAQLGTPIKEGNTELIPENKGVEVLELLQSLKKKSHPESINWNPIQLFDHMSEYDGIAYAPLAFGYTNYSRSGYGTHKLQFTDSPKAANTVLGGAGIAVSANCRFKKEATKFAAWACSAEVQKGIYLQAAGQPANKVVWTDKKANILTSDFFANTLSSLENANVRPRFAAWPKFQEYLGNVVHECLLKNGIELPI